MESIEICEGRIFVAEEVERIIYEGLTPDVKFDAVKTLHEVLDYVQAVQVDNKKAQEEILVDMAEHEPVNRLRGASEHE